MLRVLLRSESKAKKSRKPPVFAYTRKNGMWLLLLFAAFFLFVRFVCCLFGFLPEQTYSRIPETKRNGVRMGFLCNNTCCIVSSVAHFTEDIHTHTAFMTVGVLQYACVYYLNGEHDDDDDGNESTEQKKRCERNNIQKIIHLVWLHVAVFVHVFQTWRAKKKHFLFVFFFSCILFHIHSGEHCLHLSFFIFGAFLGYFATFFGE